MKKASLIAIAATIAGAWIVSADWPGASGNPRRDGWARGEAGLSRQSAANGDIKFLYSCRLDARPQRIGTPVMLTNIVSWKGLKALLFVAGDSDVYAIDYALGRPFFRTHLDYSGDKPQPTAFCPGGITAGVVIGRASGPSPDVWAVGADGYLQTLREQDGDNKATLPAKFLPANARVSDLNINNNVIYAATQAECGGNPNALYAIDLSTPEKKVVSFPTNGSGFAGSAGVAVGSGFADSDGDTVYGLIPEGQGTVAGKYRNTVVALGAKDLAVRDYFTPPGPAPALKNGAETPGATPAIFTWNGRDAIVAGGTDGRIYLLDSTSLGGPDHHTPLAQSDVFAAADGINGIWNAFATWEDPNDGNARWIYASISGAPSLKFPIANGAAPAGSIVAFKVEDRAGKPALIAEWSSRNMISPAAPAVANGLVFALSTGQTRGAGLAPRNAVLYALNSATGKEIWSSGVTATSYATGGLAIDASTVAFATHDSQIYAYGIPIIF